MILMLVVIRDKIYIIRIIGPSVYTVNEPHHDKTNKVACAPSRDSDLPRHSPCMILYDQSLLWVAGQSQTM